MKTKIIKYLMYICLFVHLAIMAFHLPTLGIPCLAVIAIDVVILRSVWEFERG